MAKTTVHIVHLYLYTKLWKAVMEIIILNFELTGGWYWGSGAEYGPSYLLEHNVILVTVNYRVGIFGLFMDSYLKNPFVYFKVVQDQDSGICGFYYEMCHFYLRHFRVIVSHSVYIKCSFKM
jgi:hypothetical protein